MLKKETLYFKSLGYNIRGSRSVEEALNKGGINYNVSKRLICLKNGDLIPDKYATVRNDNNKVLGVVGKDYCILNNSEGFSFIDEMIKTGQVNFERAGHWDKGTRSFIVVATDSVDVCGDLFTPFILFTNSHDGSGSIKAMFTPARLNSTVIIAEHRSEVKIYLRHNKNAKDRLMLAQDILEANSNYLKTLTRNAKLLDSIELLPEEFTSLVRSLAGSNKPLTNIKKERAEQMVSEIWERYNSPDLRDKKHSCWRAVLAVGNYESHRETLRDTNNPEIHFNRVISGMKLLNKFIENLIKVKKIKLYKGGKNE